MIRRRGPTSTTTDRRMAEGRLNHGDAARGVAALLNSRERFYAN